MFLTSDTLKARGADEKGLQFFEKIYPNGAELAEVIRNPKVTKEMLHWGYLHLDADESEVALYEEVLDIENCTRYFECDHIKDSTAITKSSYVSNSENVSSSARVADSKDIWRSSDVQNSVAVGESLFVFESDGIYNSKNISNSTLVCGSNYVDGGNSISDSTTILDSSCIYKSNNITNSHFLTSCNNISNSLFCFAISDSEYMLFNHSIPQKIFDNVMAQYKKIFMPYLPLNLVRKINHNNMTITRNHLSKYIYANIPKQSWEWVKTLPNYDAELMYQITLLPDFLS